MWIFGRHVDSLTHSSLFRCETGETCGLARENYQSQMNTSIPNCTFILSFGLRTGKTTASAGAVTRWMKITSARSRTHLETWDKYHKRPLMAHAHLPLVIHSKGFKTIEVVESPTSRLPLAQLMISSMWGVKSEFPEKDISTSTASAATERTWSANKNGCQLLDAGNPASCSLPHDWCPQAMLLWWVAVQGASQLLQLHHPCRFHILVRHLKDL